MLALMGKYGRLGNQLWTYANVLAYALENRISLINSAFEGGKCFNGIDGLREVSNDIKHLIHQDNALKKIVRLIYKFNLRVKYYPFIQIGESNLLNLDLESSDSVKIWRSTFVFLSGYYFYAPESLDRQKNTIKLFFSLIPKLALKVSSTVSSIRSSCDVLVGIHIRQGDYRTYCNGIMYYSSEEYASAMRSLVRQLPGKNVSFIICSDEKQNQDLFKDMNVHISTNDAVVDMYTLASCDYILGPNSSFSQWASFYGDVPLHVFDWKTAEIYGHTEPIREPDLENDFSVYSPHMFGKYSEKQVFIRELTNNSES